MHLTQKLYAEAKATYEAAVRAHASEMAQYDDIMFTDIETYDAKDAEVSERFEVEACYDVLRYAEQEMLNWALNKVRRNAAFSTAHAEAIKTINTSISAKRKLIDLAFRLA